MSTSTTSNHLTGVPPHAHRLASTLGVASLGLGLPQTLAPTAFTRAIGVQADARTRLITQFVCGVRELGVGTSILAVDRPRPARSLWSRVAGDALDLALLGAAARSKRADGRRLAAAAVAVAGIMAADAYAAAQLSRGR